jgi:hypothetical protein
LPVPDDSAGGALFPAIQPCRFCKLKFTPVCQYEDFRPKKGYSVAATFRLALTKEWVAIPQTSRE